jgi:outer membrane protein assembly factor BamB
MLWRRTFAGSLRSAPVWAGGKLAIASTAGEVAVLDPETGELSWSARTSAVIGRPSGCEDGGVVIGNAKGWIEAFDRDGSPRWRFQAGKPVFAGLASDGECVYAADAGGDVHALELASGTRRWKAKGPSSRLDAVPRVVDGNLVLQGSGLEIVLDRRTGAELVRRSNVHLEPIGAVEENGRIVRVGATGMVEELDPVNAPRWSWRATAGGFVLAPPLIGADGTVWVAEMDGTLTCVRAR